MKTKLSGSEFVAEVPHALGQKLRFARWIELLYDVFDARGESRLFKKLASEAKSFQKLTRLVAVGISDDAAKKIVEGEIGSTLKRFCQLLGQAARCFQDENGEQFKKEFLGAAADSFENIRTLLEDFSKIKDFYLMKRDIGGEI
ncbi:MAG: hypothetical protein WAO19_07300 [Candidatus Kryptoniota bacterium]